MANYKKSRRIISIIIIFLFAYQTDMLLYTQEVNGKLEKQSKKEMYDRSLFKKDFSTAKIEYKAGNYSNSIEILSSGISDINEKYNNKEMDDLLGKFYLLRGVLYEKCNQRLAEENYRKAIEMYKTDTIEGIDFRSLKIYKKVMTEEEPNNDRTIYQPGVKKNLKKKFPWLLVLGSAVVVGIVVIFAFGKKNPTPKYTLTVNLGEGVEGNPPTGTHLYEKGKEVAYEYKLLPGYNNLVVLKDGIQTAAKNTITIDKDHSLTVSADSNEIRFITDNDYISIPEGETRDINVRLSAQPKIEVKVVVRHFNGDKDIELVGQQDGKIEFTFGPGNWDQYHKITLSAHKDDDTLDLWALIAISNPDIPEKYVTVIEHDND
jgi:tetratricopeptide (TPR) repeat protein